MQMWLYDPAIQCVKRAGEEEEGAKIGEPFHSNARMTKPKPAASATLNRKMSMNLSRMFINVRNGNVMSCDCK